MPSPETGYMPDFKPTDPNTDLQDSHEALAQERVKQSTTLLPHNEKVAGEELTLNEELHKDELSELILEGMKADIAAGRLAKEQIMERVAQTITADRVHRAAASAQELEDKLEAKGKSRLRRGLNAYRNNRKLRLIIAGGTAAAALALAATGLPEIALGVKLASTALRAASAYEGSRVGFDAAGDKLKHRKERKLGFLTLDKGGRAQAWEGDESEIETRAEEEVKNGNGIKLLAMLESPHTKASWPHEQAGQYDLMVNALRDAETTRLHNHFLEVIAGTNEGGRGVRIGARKDLLKYMPEHITDRISEQLIAERKQAGADKRSHRLRKGGAILVAGVAAASGIANATDALHLFGGGGDSVKVSKPVETPESPKVTGNVMNNPFEATSGPEAPKSPLETVSQTPHSNELHRFGASTPTENYANSQTIIDRFSGNETAQQAAEKHLQNITEYKLLDPEAQQAIREKVAAGVEVRQTGDGTSWVFKTADMQNAIHNHESLMGRADVNLTGAQDVLSDNLSGLNGATEQLANNPDIVLEPLSGNETVSEAALKQLNRITEFRGVTNDTARSRIVQEVAATAQVRQGERGASWLFRKPVLLQAIYKNT